MTLPEEIHLDTRGKLCPQPIIELSRRMRSMTLNDQLIVVSDDSAFPFDCEAWCAGHGQKLLSLETEKRLHTAIIVKIQD